MIFRLTKSSGRGIKEKNCTPPRSFEEALSPTSLGCESQVGVAITFGLGHETVEKVIRSDKGQRSTIVFR